MDDKVDYIEKLQRAHPKLDMKLCVGRSWVAPGWFPLLDELCTRIEAALAADDKSRLRVQQIKEKFGRLRFYAWGNQTIAHLIVKAESRSTGICMMCGAPAKLLNIGGWHCTLCPAHEKQQREKRTLF